MRPVAPLNIYPAWSVLAPPELEVPQGHVAIVTANGRPYIFASGIHRPRYLPIGRHQVVLVDKRRRMTPLSLATDSASTWPVMLSLRLVWQVLDAITVMQIDDPGEMIHDAFQEATSDVIQSVPHDRLLPGPKRPAMPARTITNKILVELRANPALAGFRILRVILTERRGDDRRNRIMQEAEIEAERVATERRLAALTLDLNLVLRNLALQTAETERLQALEQDKVRVDQAQITAQEAALSRSALLQALELELRRKVPQWQSNLLLETMRQEGKSVQSIGKALLAMATTPGLPPSFGQDSMKIVETIVQGLTAGTAAIAQNTQFATPAMPANEPETPLALLGDDLRQLKGVKGVTTTNMAPIDETLWRVVVEVPPFALSLIVGPEHPYGPPRDLQLTKHGLPVTAELDRRWVPGMSLRAMLVAVIKPHLAPKPPKDQGNGHPPGTQPPQPRPTV